MPRSAKVNASARTTLSCCINSIWFRDMGRLGKGAINAGTRLILGEYGIAAADVQRVLLAGAFGNFVRAASVIRIGLLPDVPVEKVEFIGNAAGTGSRMVLMGKACREAADRIAKTTEYVELAGRPDFQAAFAEAMLFPER